LFLAAIHLLWRATLARFDTQASPMLTAAGYAALRHFGPGHERLMQGEPTGGLFPLFPKTGNANA